MFYEFVKTRLLPRRSSGLENIDRLMKVVGVSSMYVRFLFNHKGRNLHSTRLKLGDSAIILFTIVELAVPWQSSFRYRHITNIVIRRVPYREV